MGDGVAPADLVAAVRARAQQLLERGRLGEMAQLSRDAEQQLRRWGDDPAARVALADLLDDRSTLLAATGDDEGAAATAEEAVVLARAAGSAIAGSDRLARVLGSALTNLGTSLARRGRADEALAAHAEAVEIHRTLAARTGAVHDRANLAAALDNYGNRLAEVGRSADGFAAAREGVNLRRQLAGDDPGAYTDDLARSLNNLGGRLAEFGSPDAAGVLAEAIATYRSTPGFRTEQRAFELGACLFNAAVVAARAGNIEASRSGATEAEALLRSLSRFAEHHAQIVAFLTVYLPRMPSVQLKPHVRTPVERRRDGRVGGCSAGRGGPGR